MKYLLLSILCICLGMYFERLEASNTGSINFEVQLASAAKDSVYFGQQQVWSDGFGKVHKADNITWEEAAQILANKLIILSAPPVKTQLDKLK